MSKTKSRGTHAAALKEIVRVEKEKIREILRQRKKGLLALFITGPGANGKSTLGENIVAVARDEKHFPSAVRFYDTSDIIKAARKKFIDAGHFLGTLIEDFKPKIDGGRLLPDTIVIPTILIWLRELLSGDPDVEVIVLSGQPRTKGQLMLVKLFRVAYVVHMSISLKKANERRLRRIALSKGKVRSDDVEKVFLKRRKIYERRTLPITTAWPGIIMLDGERPLFERINAIINTMLEKSRSWEGQTRDAFVHFVVAQQNLGNNEHEVHQRIRILDAPTVPDAVAA